MLYRFSLVLLWLGWIVGILGFIGFLAIAASSGTGAAIAGAGWLVLIVAITHTLVFILAPDALHRVYRRHAAVAAPRRNPSPPSGQFEGDWPPQESADQSVYEHAAPRPLGGWLILPGIGLVFGPLGILRGIITDLEALSGATDYGQLLLTIEATLYAGYLVFAVLVSVDFFKRRARLPSRFIAVNVIGILLGMNDAVFVYLLGATEAAEIQVGRVIGATIVASIWITYFLRSQRVKETFRYA